VFKVQVVTDRHEQFTLQLLPLMMHVCFLKLL